MDLGFHVHIHAYIRLAHFNTPELKQKDGARARLRAIELLERGPLTIKTTKDKLEKYGRMLAQIMNADGVNVGEQLEAEGLARPYSGGRR